MPKTIRDTPILIAPHITGVKLNNEYIVIDLLTDETLDPKNVLDKIRIYERQVTGWFLDPTLEMVEYEPENKGFLVLMSCLSYFEGVEQYKSGVRSDHNSKETFVQSVERLYPERFNRDKISRFYQQARCGLFHDGMTRGQIVINYSYTNPIEFVNNDIHINPKLLIMDIITDFNNFITLLKNDWIARDKFDNMYSNI